MLKHKNAGEHFKRTDWPLALTMLLFGLCHSPLYGKNDLLPVVPNGHASIELLSEPSSSAAASSLPQPPALTASELAARKAHLSSRKHHRLTIKTLRPWVRKRLFTYLIH